IWRGISSVGVNEGSRFSTSSGVDFGPHTNLRTGQRGAVYLEQTADGEQSSSICGPNPHPPCLLVQRGRGLKATGFGEGGAREHVGSASGVPLCSSEAQNFHETVSEGSRQMRQGVCEPSFVKDMPPSSDEGASKGNQERDFPSCIGGYRAEEGRKDDDWRAIARRCSRPQDEPLSTSASTLLRSFGPVLIQPEGLQSPAECC
ncbi:Potassium channel KAT2, partial [Dissostichus eleginoides]